MSDHLGPWTLTGSLWEHSEEKSGNTRKIDVGVSLSSVVDAMWRTIILCPMSDES